ncbi:MAG TPA: hypothetical protein PLX89_07500 [Verrucomicrobiota bacterium]|nr:hypothetical protein [Verrucomicrobiales bacterium]HRI12834.1 hypothetical protein [Verrucomicrobiota bacterium]
MRQPRELILRLRLFLVSLSIILTVAGQVIYEPGVNVVTVVGKPGISGDRDGTGDEVLLDNVTGVAAIGQVGYAISISGTTAKIRKIVGRTATTIATFEAVRGKADLVGDPGRLSLLARGDGGTFSRINQSGSTIGTLNFSEYCAVGSDKAALPNDRRTLLSLLDLRSGNAIFLAGGTTPVRRDGVGESAGFESIVSSATADGLCYVNDNGAIRTVTFSGEVRTLLLSGGEYKDGDASDAKGFAGRPMAIDQGGNLIFAQGSFPTAIRRLSKNAIHTVAGSPNISANFDGEGFNARFSYIQGLAIDSDNRLWVADQNCVRLVTFPESEVSPPPQMAIRLIPGITVSGEIGGIYRIEFQEDVNDSWQLLRLVVLSRPDEEFFDYEARGRSRFYRVTPTNR